jgi:rhodanese-related sulfurtransferase
MQHETYGDLVQPSVRNISAVTLASMMERGTPLHLLDVREAFELTAFGAIPGVRNIPMREVAERLHEIPSEGGTTIVVICQSGNRSSDVARYLAAKGYGNICNLDGGTSAWIQSGQRVTGGVQGGRKRG